MEYLRQRRQARKAKPRPYGRLKNAWHKVVNFFCFCILSSTATDSDDTQDVYEPVLDKASWRAQSRQSSNITMTTKKNSPNHKVFHNKSIKEPCHFNIRKSQSEPCLLSSGKKTSLAMASTKVTSSWISLALPKITNANNAIENNNSNHSSVIAKSPSSLLDSSSFTTVSSLDSRYKPDSFELGHIPSRRSEATSCSSCLTPVSSSESQNKAEIVQNSSYIDDLEVSDGKSDGKSLGKREKGKSSKKRRNTDIDAAVENGKPKDSAKVPSKMSLNSSTPKHIVLEHKAGSYAVPGGTIPDLYGLIKRALNLGMSTSIESNTKDFTKKDQTEAPSKDNESNKREESHLPNEWNDSIVNVEVLLGLKKPKNSYEALAVRRELGSDAPDWCNDGYTTRTRLQPMTATGIRPKS